MEAFLLQEMLSDRFFSPCEKRWVFSCEFLQTLCSVSAGIVLVPMGQLWRMLFPTVFCLVL